MWTDPTRLDAADPVPVTDPAAGTTTVSAVTSILELLDHQYGLLRTKDGVQFVQELPRFYRFITAGPHEVVAALNKLREEAKAIEGSFEDHDRTLTGELAALKEELAARAPEADDSGAPRPKGDFRPEPEWIYGFSNFDQIVADGPDRMIEQQDRDPGKSGMLIRILQSKLNELQWMTVSPRGLRTRSQTNQREDLDDLGRRLGNLAERHRHEKQTLLQAFDQHAGFQIQYLDLTIEEMNPPPSRIDSDADHERRANDLFKRWAGGWDAIASAASGGRLDDIARQRLDYHVRQLKPAAEHLYEDLRLKLAASGDGQQDGPHDGAAGPAEPPSWRDDLTALGVIGGLVLAAAAAVVGALGAGSASLDIALIAVGIVGLLFGGWWWKRRGLGWWRALRRSHRLVTIGAVLLILVVVALVVGTQLTSTSWVARADQICRDRGREYLAAAGNPRQRTQDQLRVSEEALADLETVSVPADVQRAFNAILDDKRQLIGYLRQELALIERGKSSGAVQSLQFYFLDYYGNVYRPDAQGLKLDYCGQETGLHGDWFAGYQ